MFWNSPVRQLRRDGADVGSQTIRSRWVVAADGPNSRMAVLAGLADKRLRGVRFGFREHYRVTPWTSHVEVYWAKAGQVYVTPISADQVCVALITRFTDIRLPKALNHFPQLQEKLAGATLVTAARSAATSTRRLPGIYRGNFALVGGASGSVDAVTGEGLSLCFQQAFALQEALVREDLAHYQRSHRRLQRLPFVMAELMLTMDRHPALRRRALKALSRKPDLFSRLLAIHVGAAPALGFGLRGGLSLGWSLLRS